MMELITKFDVEMVIYREKYNQESGGWPEGFVGVSVYPDEVQLRIDKEENRSKAEGALRKWFGAKYKDGKLYLDYSSNGEKRYLNVTFEVAPGEKQYMPSSLKPDFANFSLYPENPSLKGPDFDKLRGLPSMWAFYSFKGGVGRTLHLVSLAKRLSELDTPKKVLIVDADLEAPGLTWWEQERSGVPVISLLDFLALVHYDHSPGLSDSLKITADNLQRQMMQFETKKLKTYHYFLPAFRYFDQLMRMPIRPEHICWESGKEWILPELLWKLGKTLDVHAVLVDLRAGLSEISSPFLLDPRVNRAIVTTPSGQSVEGTLQVLSQLKKVSLALKESSPSNESKIPIVILSMIKQEMKDSPGELGSIKSKLIEMIPTDSTEAQEVIGKEILIESMFDWNLQYLKDLDSTLEKLDNSEVDKVMKPVAEGWFPTDETFSQNQTGEPIVKQEISKHRKDLEKLRNASDLYQYGESGKATDFLITQNLRNIAQKYTNNIPEAVIMGPKGSGKTYTYLQLAHLKEWSQFIIKVRGKSNGATDGFIWPLLGSTNLEKNALDIIDCCRQNAIDKTGGAIAFKKLNIDKIDVMINGQIQTGNIDLTGWKNFWIGLMARSMSCENAPDPLEAMQTILEKKNIRLIFQFDGIEDRFKDSISNKVHQAAVQALCLNAINAVREWPGNRVGMVVFTRKDIVRSSITQNFGQFHSRFKDLEIRWNKDEALRLAAWLTKEVAKLDYVNYTSPIENVTRAVIENELKGLWGEKMGPPKSREAYTANWLMAALSDFNGQLQPRDLVRLIYNAAHKALELEQSPDRLLPPSALKNALEPCSTEKIKEIEMEIPETKSVFKKMRELEFEKRKVPIDSTEINLSSNEIELMKTLGFLTEIEGEYYLPEIIRRGLGFKSSKPGRLKVLNLLKTLD